MKPAFAFGHGLSYGTFEYDKVSVTGRTISFTVKRSSGVGCDTPQLYISYPTAKTDSKVPSKVLRYFQKTCEASTDIKYELSDADVSNWHPESKAWKVTTGTFTVSVGASSQDIRQTATVEVS